MFWCFVRSQFPGAVNYTTQASVDSVSLFVPNLLESRGDWRIHVYERQNGDELTRIEELRLVRDFLLDEDSRDPMVGLNVVHLVRQVENAIYFLDGGLVVQEDDEDFGRDMKPFQELLMPLKHSMPKYFTEAYLGSARSRGWNPDERATRARDMYFAHMRSRRWQHMLKDETIKRFLSYVSHFARTLRFNTTGFKDDVDLVALACAADEGEVHLCSNDGDVVCMTDIMRDLHGFDRIKSYRMKD